jgi:AAHS family 4-hydroxybenzoate transporter-like MFS transporter
MLWIPFFLGFMVIITVVLWGPALLREGGVSIASASIVFAAHYLGGFIGTAGSGYLVDRFGATKVIIPGFLLGGASLLVFGHVMWSVALLCLVAFSVGLFVVGASNGLLSIAAAVYPTRVRSSGLGWAMGMGRVGQLVGPVLVGLMVSAQSSSSAIFMAASIPCVIAAVFVWAIVAKQIRDKESAPDGRPALRHAEV